MFDTTLSTDQQNWLIKKVGKLDAKYDTRQDNADYFRDKRLIGEGGEIAFANWLRYWDHPFEKQPEGTPFDYLVDGYRIEVATTRGWWGDRQCLSRKPDKIKRNVPQTDLFVGVAMLRPYAHYRVYGCCMAPQMYQAEVRQWRPDLPEMQAVPIDECLTMTGLNHLLHLGRKSRA